MATSSQQRLQELESRFSELEDKLTDTPEKEAISILHAMLQENLRAGSSKRSGKNGKRASGVTLEDIAARQIKWLIGGSLSHPTVQVGGQVLVEPSLDELDWTLNEAGVIQWRN